MARRRYTDVERLFDLFQVTAPRFDEHRLTFSIRFSCSESQRLKTQGPKLNSEALRTIRNLLKDGSGKLPVLDIVLVVERNRRPYAAFIQNVYGFHAHGWVRCKKTFTSTAFDARVNSKKGRKLAPVAASSSTHYNPLWNYDYKDEYAFEDDYIPLASGQSNFVFKPDLHPIDSGWVAYMAKEFHRNPNRCRHLFAATRHTSTEATGKRKTRSKEMERIFRSVCDDSLVNWPDLRRRR